MEQKIRFFLGKLVKIYEKIEKKRKEKRVESKPRNKNRIKHVWGEKRDDLKISKNVGKTREKAHNKIQIKVNNYSSFELLSYLPSSLSPNKRVRLIRRESWTSSGSTSSWSESTSIDIFYNDASASTTTTSTEWRSVR